MSRDQLDQRALQADSLRKQGMTKAEIASHLTINERQAGRLLARAGRYYRDLVRNFDQERFLGDTLVFFLSLEREALKNLKAVDPDNPVAVKWLEAALDIRREIKEMLHDFVFGRTRSRENGIPGEDMKSRRDKARAKLKKLDKGKDRNLYCVRPDPQGPDSTDSK